MATSAATHDDHAHGHAHDDHAHDDHAHSHDHGHSGIHESPAVMWIPLAILAVLSLVGGFINIPKFLEPIFPLVEGAEPEWLGYIAIASGLGGIALAALFYLVERPARTRLRNQMGVFAPA